MKAKTFSPGEVVEIRRTPSAEWEPAIYVQSMAHRWKAHHEAMLPPGRGRYIDSMSGSDLGVEGDRKPLENPRAYLSYREFVPSRRIRARRVRTAEPGVES